MLSCECCEGINEAFVSELHAVRLEHKHKLFGLCLDCFTAGGFNTKPCRYDHKAVEQTSEQNGGSRGETSALGIQGL